MINEKDLVIRNRKMDFGIDGFNSWCNEWDEVRKMVLGVLPKDRQIPIVKRTKGEIENGIKT